MLLVPELVYCKKSFVTCCKICSLLVTEFARSKKSLVLRYENSPENNVYLNPKKIREVSSKNVGFNNLIQRENTPGLFFYEIAVCKTATSLKKGSNIGANVGVNFAKVTRTHFCQSTCK